MGLIPLYSIPFENCWTCLIELLLDQIWDVLYVRDLWGSATLRVPGILIIFVGLRSVVSRASGGVSGFSCTYWRWGSSRIYSYSGRRLWLSQCLDFFEQSYMNTGCRFFSWEATSQSRIISIYWSSICFCMVKSVWRSWSSLSGGSGSTICISSCKAVLELESSASEI